LALAKTAVVHGVALQEEISSSMRVIFLAVSSVSGEGLVSCNKIVEHSLFVGGATAKASIIEANCFSKDGVLGAQKALPANPVL
jgi:hypothetical protein